MEGDEEPRGQPPAWGFLSLRHSCRVGTSASGPTRGVPRKEWDRVSDRYDRQLWLEHSAVAAALDLANPKPSDRLLDLGTGTGEVLRELATRPTRPLHAVGVDSSAAMLSHVPALPTGWSVREADALALPFPAAAFTIAVASYVLHVLPQEALATAMGELARVLCTGGRVVTVTPVVPARGPMWAIGAASDVLARLAPARFGGLRSLDPRDALQQAGFTVLRGTTVLRGYPSLCVLAELSPSASGASGS